MIRKAQTFETLWGEDHVWWNRRVYYCDCGEKVERHGDVCLKCHKLTQPQSDLIEEETKAYVSNLPQSLKDQREQRIGIYTQWVEDNIDPVTGEPKFGSEGVEPWNGGTA